MASSPIDVRALQTLVGVKADGDFGPRSQDAAIAFVKELVGPEVWNELQQGRNPMLDWKKIGLGVAAAFAAIGTGLVLTSDPRAKVVKIARGEIGPQNPDKYWSEVQPKLMGQPTKIAWCGGNALWVLHKAGLTDVPWEPSIGFAARLLKTTKNPQPGDVAYFDQPFQHHAIVEKVVGDQLYTIDGNQSPGEQVLPRIRPLNAATAFYSIQSLIDKKKGIA